MCGNVSQTFLSLSLRPKRRRPFVYLNLTLKLVTVSVIVLSLRIDSTKCSKGNRHSCRLSCRTKAAVRVILTHHNITIISYVQHWNCCLHSALWDLLVRRFIGKPVEEDTHMLVECTSSRYYRQLLGLLPCSEPRDKQIRGGSCSYTRLSAIHTHHQACPTALFRRRVSFHFDPDSQAELLMYLLLGLTFQTPLPTPMMRIYLSTSTALSTMHLAVRRDFTPL